MENFQSQWPYNDAFYIGETGYAYEFPGETHSGKDIRLVNSNALGFPDKLNDEGGFNIGYVGNQKWRLAGDIRSPSTGIIHGVKAYPKYDHPIGPSDILLENKKGKFVEATNQANLHYEEYTTSAAVADLDNNGWQDLIVIRRVDLIHENESIIYLNQGASGFQQLSSHNIISPELGAIGMGVETLDYNQDGKVDVILGNERGKWHLFKNVLQEANIANYLTIVVGNSESGKATGLGAIVSVKACGGEQIKRIGSTGAAYSLSFNNFIHFGFGECRGPVRVKVEWTNGEIVEKTFTSLNDKVMLGLP